MIVFILYMIAEYHADNWNTWNVFHIYYILDMNSNELEPDLTNLILICLIKLTSELKRQVLVAYIEILYFWGDTLMRN